MTAQQAPEALDWDGSNADALVGEAVHVMMRRRGLTQATVAGRLGIHQVSLGKKLLGQRPWRLDELVKVASVLDVDVATFTLSLPRLDSNQQPSGYALALVSEGVERLAEVVPIARWRAGRHHPSATRAEA